MDKPDKRDFGWEEPGLYDEGGWTIEGGEEAYDEAFLKWKSVLPEALENRTIFACPFRCGIIDGYCDHCGKTYKNGKVID